MLLCYSKNMQNLVIANKERRKVYNQRYYAKARTPTSARNYYLKTTYGITLAEYHDLLDAQGGVCAICSEPPRGVTRIYLHVDHDHVSKKVRGLLCNQCNGILGKWKDSPVTAQRAVDYLIKHQS